MRVAWVLMLVLLTPGAAADAAGVHLSWDGQGYAVSFTSHSAAPSVTWDGGQVPAAATGDSAWVARLPAGATRYSVEGRSFSIQPRPAPGATMRVAFLADVGRTNDSWGILDQVARANPDLVIVGGDISYANGDAAAWDDWLAHLEPLASRVPLMVAMGNHETLCSQGDQLYVCGSEPKEYAEHFAMPDAPSRFYSFDWGPVHFTALDTEAYHHDPALRPNETKPEEQLAFLNASLAARPDAWQIVYFHRPLYSSNAHDDPPDPQARADLVPALQTGGADLVLYGHAHAYERTYPMRDGERAPDGRGIVYVDSGGGGESLYPEFQADRPAWSATRSVTYEFVLLTVSPDSIRGQAIGEDGQVLDAFTIAKPGAPTQESRLVPLAAEPALLAAVALAAVLRRALR